MDTLFPHATLFRSTAVREEGRNRIVASSVADFSGEQGRGNWYYGYYDGDGEGKGDGAEPKGPYTDDDFKMLKRSEEHTSELQSLMRISYAVLCLKKKKQT